MRFKKSVIFCFFACLCIAVGGLMLYINLPALVTSQAHMHLPKLLNSDQIEFDIKRVGFSNFHIFNIRQANGVSVDSIDLVYQIKGIKKIEIERVQISGLTIQAELDSNNKIQVQGVEIPKASGASKNGEKELNLALLPKKVVLRHGKLLLTAFQKQVLIPFSALAAVNAHESSILIQAMMHPQGQEIRGQVSYHLNNGIQKVILDGQSVDLEVLNPLISRLGSNVLLQNELDFKIESQGTLEKWQLNLSRAAMIKPVDMRIEQLEAVLNINGTKMDVQGSVDLGYGRLPKITAVLDAKADFAPTFKFDVQIKSRAAPDLTIDFPNGQCRIQAPVLSGQITGSPKKGKASLSFKTPSCRVNTRTSVDKDKKGKQFIILAGTNITSDLVFDLSDRAVKKADIQVKAVNTGITVQSEQGSMKFSEATFTGRASLDQGNHPSGQAVLTASKGTLVSKANQIKASGIELVLPIAYPFDALTKGTARSGTYQVPDIRFQNTYRFKTKGKITQTGSKAFTIKGLAGFKTLPALKAEYDCRLDLDNDLNAGVDLKINPFKITRADIESVIGPKFQNADISALVSATAKARIKKHTVETGMRIDINEGELFFKDSNLSVKGIQTRLDMADLINIRSLPAQIMTVDSIDVNDVKITNANLRFSIENKKSVLVENLRFNWCNGLVSSEAIRFSNTNNQYGLTLYCDRLELTQLLSQLGAFHAEGNGTLNGRIPVVYSDGDISFNDGFLFSTPGSGGRVAIENTNKLTAGIPMDSPQFSQLDLAQEALKDFNYKWAKLRLNTIDDTLAVAMELDGKPSKTLPFKYEKQFGGFVRVDAKSPGSNFQGIKLDVNLKLPFNDVMKFGNKLKSLF